MYRPVYITVTAEHIGKNHIEAFGEVILAEQFSGEYCPRDFVQDDVGRRVYLFPPHQISIEPADQQRRREAFFTVYFLCELHGLTVWLRSAKGPFAMGNLGCGTATPWFERLSQLEEYCQQNLDGFRRRALLN